MRMKKKPAAALLAVCCLAPATSAYAFSDIQDPGQDQIAASLQSQGILQGVSAEQFAPTESLTAAQSVQLLVKAMNLKAGGGTSSTAKGNISAGAWYAQAANIAADNGISISQIHDWNSKLTREQFAEMLFKAVTATAGTHPTVQMIVEVADENEILSDRKAAVQYLLLSRIAKLDEQNMFHPKQYISRMEAAEMIYKARQFIQSQDNSQDPGESADEIAIQVNKINDEVNQIIISKSDMPNPGYGIVVDRIEFSGQKAVAYYHFTTPEPGKMYPQVISTAKASFYLDSKYKVSVKRSPGQDGLKISNPGLDKKSLK